MGGCLSSIEEADSERGSGSGLPTSNVVSANGDLHKYTVPVTVSQVLHMEFPTLPPSPSSSLLSTSNSNSNFNWNSAKFFVCSSDLLYYDEYIQALNGEYQLQPDQLYFVLPASKLQYPITASDMAALAAKASLALSHSLHKSSSNSSSYNKPSSSSSSSSSSSIRQGRHHRARARQNNMARISPFLEEVNINNNTSTSKSTSTSKRDNHHQRVPSSSNSDGKHYYYYEMVEEDRDELKGFSDKSYPEEALGVAGGGGVLSSSVSEKKSMRRIRSKQRQKNRYRYSGGAKVAVRSFRIQLTTIYEGSVLHFY
ncbi:uncharacterized serine-rich protein C1E8.05-like [Camellia sinensis]|uniref:uncharacterized serine-rich protein C1E8.05-like n=1 Tax=Camellia sinensis TaxID=4442 RepID=UPI001035C7C4|nr:uncharacterized serine-rich protein C1E8.05-like [Camellia sinensis]